MDAEHAIASSGEPTPGCLARFGLAPALSAATSGPLWSTAHEPLHASGEVSQRLEGLPAIDWTAATLGATVRGRTPNELPKLPGPTSKAPIAPNAYSDGSIKRPHPHAWAVGAPRLSSAMRAWKLRGGVIVICLIFASKTPRAPRFLQRLCLAQPFLLPGLRL